jgi:hypothetical protein
VDEAALRRHLDEAHRQLNERDREFQLLEEELHRDHERVVTDLTEQVEAANGWAREVEEELHEMQQTRAWRVAARLRRLRGKQ